MNKSIQVGNGGVVVNGSNSGVINTNSSVINTGGGAYIGGSVIGGSFVGGNMVRGMFYQPNSVTVIKNEVWAGNKYLGKFNNFTAAYSQDGFVVVEYDGNTVYFVVEDQLDFSKQISRIENINEQQVINLIKSSRSEHEWNANCDIVKKAFNGYPNFWYNVIIRSGLANEVQESWTNPKPVLSDSRAIYQNVYTGDLFELVETVNDEYGTFYMLKDSNGHIEKWNNVLFAIYFKSYDGTKKFISRYVDDINFAERVMKLIFPDEG